MIARAAAAPPTRRDAINDKFARWQHTTNILYMVQTHIFYICDIYYLIRQYIFFSMVIIRVLFVRSLRDLPCAPPPPH